MHTIYIYTHRNTHTHTHTHSFQKEIIDYMKTFRRKEPIMILQFGRFFPETEQRGEEE